MTIHSPGVRLTALAAALLLPAASAHAVSAGCTTVNGGAWDDLLTAPQGAASVITAQATLTFEKGEVVVFESTSSSGGENGSNITVLGPGSYDVSVQNQVVPNPASWRAPFGGNFRAEYLATGNFSNEVLRVVARCFVEGTGDRTATNSPIADETQNTSFDTAFQQTKHFNATLNRALANRLAVPGGTEAGSFQASRVDGAVAQASGLSAGDVQRGRDWLTPDGGAGSGATSASVARVLAALGSGYSEGGEMVSALDAAAQETTDSINRALRNVGLGNGFFFSDVTGSIVFDDRNSNAKRDGNEVFVTTGFGYNANDNLTFGLGSTISWADRPLAASIGDQELFGFAVNPFVAYRWRSVVFSANGGLGRTSSEVRVDEIPGLNADYDTYNYNVAGSVLGNIRWRSFWFTPRGTLSYNWANAEQFTDAFGLTGADQSENYGELSGSFRLAYDGRVMGNGTRIMPWLEPSIYYAFERPGTYSLAAGGTYRTEEFTADIEGGLDFLMKNGLQFSLGAAYRGINQNDLERVTVRGELNWKW